MSEKQTIYDRALAEMSHGLLSRYSHMQAEAIARHYASLATVALQLLKLLECRRQTGSYPEMDSAIQRLTDEIKTKHRKDFGIELEWPKNYD